MEIIEVENLTKKFKKFTALSKEEARVYARS